MSGFPEQEPGEWSVSTGYHLLPTPLPVSKIRLGDFIATNPGCVIPNGRLVILSRGEKEPKFDGSHRDSHSNGPSTYIWTAQDPEVTKRHTVEMPNCQQIKWLDNVTAEACLKAVEASRGVKRWLEDTKYGTSMYLVIGLKSSKEYVGPWPSSEESAVFAVRLMKISCVPLNSHGKLGLTMTEYQSEPHFYKPWAC